MTGAIVRIGRYRTASGPDLGSVSGPQQLASFTNPASTGSPVILYKGGSWIGKYSGNPVARVALMWTAADGTSPNGLRPGGVAAYTNEMVPTVNYTGAGGGQSMEAGIVGGYFVTDPGYAYTLAATNSTGVLGIAMFQASAITEPNEYFYRKNLSSGNIPVDGVSSSASNEGQLCIWFEGEANVAPNAPTSLNPSGANLLISRTPWLTANFSDANETLNNGVAYDYVAGAQVEIRTGSTSGPIVWSTAWDTNATEKANRITGVTCGATLNYDTTYYYRVRHRDRIGLWSSWASTTFSIKSPNEPPYAPDNLSPSGDISGGLTPVLSMRHRDPDAHASSYAQIQVVRESDSASMMDTTWSVVVANNGTINRTYNGSTLSYNTWYKWRGRTMDSQGAWGPYSGYVSFRISNLASVDKPSSPVGWQATTTPANIVSVYRHNNAKNSNGFQVRLFNNVGATIATSSWIAKTVAPNGTVTITWAETGFGALANGTTYQVALLARDTDNVVAVSWSTVTIFNTNAAPNIPIQVSPANGFVGSSLPNLVSSATDPDNGVTSVLFRVETSGGTLIGEYWGTSIGNNQYQVLASAYSGAIPGYGTYRFAASAYDGYLWSGYGTWVTFQYAAVPTVTVTAPAGPTVATSQPTISWTATQVAYRVTAWAGSTKVYDTGEVMSSSVKSHVVQASANWIGGERWNNGESFSWVVSVRSSAGLWGYSASLSLQLVYVPPTSLPVYGDAVSLPQTTQINAIMMSHPQTDVAVGGFQRYIWYRADLDDEGEIIVSTVETIREITNIADTQILDANVASGKRYAWWVVVEELRGNDLVQSAPVYYFGSVEWEGVIIHAPFDPLNTALELRWSLDDEPYDPETNLNRSMDYVESMKGERIFFMSRKLNRDQGGNFEILEDEGVATINDRIKTLYYLMSLQGGDIDGIPHIACWRNGRGSVINDVIYGVINPNVKIVQNTDWQYDLTISFLESSYRMGITEQ